MPCNIVWCECDAYERKHVAGASGCRNSAPVDTDHVYSDDYPLYSGRRYDGPYSSNSENNGRGRDGY